VLPKPIADQALRCNLQILLQIILLVGSLLKAKALLDMCCFGNMASTIVVLSPFGRFPRQMTVSEGYPSRFEGR